MLWLECITIKYSYLLKTLYKFNAINVTIGLPFLKITPDHGPNIEMAGKNKSDPSSINIMHLISCVKLNEFFSQEKLRTEFLNNKEIINLIIDQGNINTKDIVLEVGPGTGSLTKNFWTKIQKNFL